MANVKRSDHGLSYGEADSVRRHGLRCAGVGPNGDYQAGVADCQCAGQMYGVGSA